MKVSKERGVLLVEIPLCGCASVSKGLRLAPVTEEKFEVPDHDFRRQHAALFNRTDYYRMALVRHPFDRFLSAVTRLLRSDEFDLRSLGASDSFIGMTDQAMGLLPRAAQATELVVNWLLNNKASLLSDTPYWFWPQTTWLVCKVDLPLATHSIASWANTKNIAALRTNASRLTQGPIAAAYSQLESSLRELYREDYALLRNLRVWSNNGKVESVFGRCAVCSAKLGADEEVNNLHTVQTPKKKKATRKRMKTKMAGKAKAGHNEEEQAE